jgi:malate dehydrogenase (quinone)
VTDNPAITAQHTAKVYGRADLGAPPMSVPHIDTRYIDGKNMCYLVHLQLIQTSS